MQKTLDSNIVNKDVTTSEIIWALKSVVSGFSNNSCDDFAQTLRAMCPDSKIANDFKLGRTKLMYLVNYSIAPHFKSLLDTRLKKVPIYTLSFDESLNKVTHECEMVIMVRYWDDDDDQVKVRYLGSTLFGHATAVDLSYKFVALSKDRDPKRLYQISMDGPRVNIKFLKDIQKKREDLFHSLIDIGTCSLHSVNGSVKVGFEKSSLKIKETLKGGFQILHHSPARREDFESITGSTKYLLYFCATRWVENKLVTDHMVEVWPHLIKIVNFWDSLQKSKQPSCKSYENICDGVRDP